MADFPMPAFAALSREQSQAHNEYGRNFSALLSCRKSSNTSARRSASAVCSTHRVQQLRILRIRGAVLFPHRGTQGGHPAAQHPHRTVHSAAGCGFTVSGASGRAVPMRRGPRSVHPAGTGKHRRIPFSADDTDPTFGGGRAQMRRGTYRRQGPAGRATWRGELHPGCLSANTPRPTCRISHQPSTPCRWQVSRT